MSHSILAVGTVPVKAWVDGVDLDPKVQMQAAAIAKLPFIHSHVALMPDCHVGTGSCIGAVIPTIRAIVPAAVGVDIGCGMMAQLTAATANDLVDSHWRRLRDVIENTIPVGRTDHGGANDKGAWRSRYKTPELVYRHWKGLQPGYDKLTSVDARLEKRTADRVLPQLGTLGTGNHFIEICLDELDRVWLMLHSGSRGVGNAIGTHYIEKAQREAERWHIQLPNKDLAYLPEGSEYFDQYVAAMLWAQDYAKANRQIMMTLVREALAKIVPRIGGDKRGAGSVVPALTAVNCHHNYCERENHFGENVWVTRKGAVRAREGDYGIIPGSMGAKSFIVRGKGNPASFNSCSHGAGRKMSRTAARERFTVDEHLRATAGIECRKDSGVLDETPGAYKDIDAVMAAQSDLVEVVHTLKQIVCVKG